MSMVSQTDFAGEQDLSEVEGQTWVRPEVWSNYFESQPESKSDGWVSAQQLIECTRLPVDLIYKFLETGPYRISSRHWGHSSHGLAHHPGIEDPSDVMVWLDDIINSMQSRGIRCLVPTEYLDNLRSANSPAGEERETETVEEQTPESNSEVSVPG